MVLALWVAVLFLSVAVLALVKNVNEIRSQLSVMDKTDRILARAVARALGQEDPFGSAEPKEGEGGR